MGPTEIADGFQKYGALVWGLSLALFALATVSILLLKAKNREIDRAEKRVDSLEAQLMALQEKRIGDRDAFQGKLDALARESTETSTEVVHQVAELVREVKELREHQPRRRPKEGAG